MSEATKLAIVKRLLRMLTRVLLGSSKMAEYDALVARLEAMTPEEREADMREAVAKFSKSLDGGDKR